MHNNRSVLNKYKEVINIRYVLILNNIQILKFTFGLIYALENLASKKLNN